jgi:maltose O-acetyltransferase
VSDDLADLPPPSEMERRMLAGERYLAGDERLSALWARAQRMARRIEALDPADHDARLALEAQLFGSFGPGASVLPPFRCDYGVNVHLGANAFVNFGAVLLDVVRIDIGDDCQLGPGVQLLTAAHPIDPEVRRTRWEWGEPIVLERDVWLGGGVIVLPGVTIGAGTVVGAGAVVTKNLPSGVVAVGNPARVLREIGPQDR